jgi:hypothetical protein
VVVLIYLLKKDRAILFETSVDYMFLQHCVLLVTLHCFVAKCF